MNLKNEFELGDIYQLFTEQAFTDIWKFPVNYVRLYLWKLEIYLMANFFH